MAAGNIHSLQAHVSSFVGLCKHCCMKKAVLSFTRLTFPFFVFVTTIKKRHIHDSSLKINVHVFVNTVFLHFYLRSLRVPRLYTKTRALIQHYGKVALWFWMPTHRLRIRVNVERSERGSAFVLRCSEAVTHSLPQPWRLPARRELLLPLSP